MILETIIFIKDVSNLKETKEGDKFYSVLLEVQKKDWDFGVRTEVIKVSTDKDLTAHKGKKIKSRVELYISKSNEIVLKILEILQ